MANLNKVLIIGNLGADPELRYTADGSAICNVSIATTRKWRDKATGENREEVEWHRVAFFNRLAEIAGEYLRKGRSVYVEGRLRTRKWQDQSGQDRYTTEIVANEMQMLGGRDDGNDGYGGGQQQYQQQQPRQQQRQQPQQNQYAQQSGGRQPQQNTSYGNNQYPDDFDEPPF